MTSPWPRVKPLHCEVEFHPRHVRSIGFGMRRSFPYFGRNGEVNATRPLMPQNSTVINEVSIAPQRYWPNARSRVNVSTDIGG
jgi:hypothetical protein